MSRNSQMIFLVPTPPGAAEFVICDHTIEFNFRDAKQYWGLEDFMKVTPTGVTNAANLSLFMVNVAYRLCTDVRPRDPDYSILDLKADCRGYKYVEETIQMYAKQAAINKRERRCGSDRCDLCRW